ncbi:MULTISPECIES: DUF6694 family lipoprotein [unclassified Bartonella]|uniref:DUF6694 family lipoprotein n=1 Tax=unclassified Bartonella TaxID=2645622 RepID=UPI0015FDB39E|nr:MULTISPECIES: DUF6694 family lipoprotein [unclassified Bartonella]UXN03686.1 hypothetical protein N6B01_01175 [Bartonella sp. HY406]UXN06658.1 hypothetical protein N6A79_01185 [Bartonella sp. HY761]
MKKFLGLLAVALMVSACGSEPTIDMSDATKATESTQKVVEKLSAEDKVKFQQAVAKIMADIIATGETDQAKMEAALKDKIQGKTGKQIIEMNK